MDCKGKGFRDLLPFFVFVFFFFVSILFLYSTQMFNNLFEKNRGKVESHIYNKLLDFNSFMA